MPQWWYGRCLRKLFITTLQQYLMYEEQAILLGFPKGFTAYGLGFQHAASGSSEQIAVQKLARTLEAHLRFISQHTPADQALEHFAACEEKGKMEIPKHLARFRRYHSTVPEPVTATCGSVSVVGYATK